MPKQTFLVRYTLRIPFTAFGVRYESLRGKLRGLGGVLLAGKRLPVELTAVGAERGLGGLLHAVIHVVIAHV